MAEVRFDDVRYLGGYPQLTRRVSGTLDVSRRALTLRSPSLPDGQLTIPRSFVRSARVVAADEAEQWTRGVELLAPVGHGAVLILGGSNGEAVVFEIVTWGEETVSTVSDSLATVLPAPAASRAAPRSTPTTQAPAAPPPLRYDLHRWNDSQRKALTAELVAHGTPHGWTGDTLNVARGDKALVDTLITKVRPPWPYWPGRTAAYGAGGSQRRPGSTPISEQLDTLERLVALRDAGGLTPEEFDAARARAAQHLIEGES